jgi:hypothetical protein
MSKQRKVRDLRSFLGKRATSARASQRAEVASRLEKFVSENFAEETASVNPGYTLLTFDVSSFKELLSLLHKQYPNTPQFDLVTMANSVWQETDFRPSDKAVSATTGMVSTWNEHFRNAESVDDMRKCVKLMGKMLGNVAVYTMMDVAAYGHPSPRDDKKNAEVGFVRPHSVMGLVRFGELSSVVTAFLDLLRLEQKAEHKHFFETRNYINRLFDGEQLPFRYLAIWTEKELPPESKRWTYSEGGELQLHPDVYSGVMACPCLVPEHMQMVPEWFADSLRLILDPSAALEQIENKVNAVPPVEAKNLN